MGNCLVQWRCAIGVFNNFIKSKESLAVNVILHFMYLFGPLTMLLLHNLQFKYIVLMILFLKCGDVHPNPGPLKFCHLNARSILAGVDLNQHIDDQYSLLDDIYEALVYINDFDVIAISETWLKDNVREDALDLAGYQLPICKNRATRGGGVMLYVPPTLSIGSGSSWV